MLQNRRATSTSDAGFISESLSNEVLKLKIDDLYQEIETLRGRLMSLEDRLGAGGKGRRDRAVVSSRNVSEPDDR